MIHKLWLGSTSGIRLSNFWKFLATNFVKKVAQNNWCLFELNRFLSKNCCGYFLFNVRNILGYFFQHPVTLASTDLAQRTWTANLWFGRQTTRPDVPQRQPKGWFTWAAFDAFDACVCSRSVCSAEKWKIYYLCRNATVCCSRMC